MRLTLSWICGLAVVLSGCGTAKKLDAANAQIQSLNAQVSTLNGKVAENEKQISRLQSENANLGKEAAECQELKTAVAQRLDNLNAVLAENGTSLKEIHQKAERALDYFLKEGAEVTYKNGFVHISIPDKMAFPSGSTKVSDDGRQIISVVADILNDYPKVTAIIVGNTDSVKVSKKYIDNWSLSTERANAIVRTLRDTYHVNPAQLTAAGRGKFHPIADNSTSEGRAKNRRTDILINTDLSRLWELSESH